MSSAELIHTVASLLTLISSIIFCILYSFILTIQDFYSCFHRLFHLLLNLCLWKSSSPDSGMAASSSEPRPTATMISHGDVELVMKQLGLNLGHGQTLSQDSVDITSVFEREDPSLDEVREAFGMFDENKDGFVDAEELEKMMSSLGVVGLSEEECGRMIMAFDDDGDGRISFGEFVKLIEENVSC